jgi:hypothetical protein
MSTTPQSEIESNDAIRRSHLFLESREYLPIALGFRRRQSVMDECEQHTLDDLSGAGGRTLGRSFSLEAVSYIVFVGGGFSRDVRGPRALAPDALTSLDGLPFLRWLFGLPGNPATTEVTGAARAYHPGAESLHRGRAAPATGR